MKISFLGTRGNINAVTTRHQRHAVTVITYQQTRVAIDCGLDWWGSLDEINPDAFVITHAHDDHVDGLKEGTSCPVYATEASWQRLRQFPIKEGIIINYREPFMIGSLTFEAFFVQHSLCAPAVGYRISGGSTIIFCVHDLLAIEDQHDALKDVQLYIGDGASITRPIIRYQGIKPFGHTTIAQQLEWCKQEGVLRAIFTHCGSQIVKRVPHEIEKEVQEYGANYGIDTCIAYDGMEINL